MLKSPRDVGMTAGWSKCRVTPGLRALTFHELDAITMPSAVSYRASSAFSAASISGRCRVGELARLAHDLAGRAERHLEGDRFVRRSRPTSSGASIRSKPMSRSRRSRAASSPSRDRPSRTAPARRSARPRRAAAGSSRTTAFGSPKTGFSPIVRQTIITIRRPASGSCRMFRSAATGFSKNCVPKREKQRSKSPSNG